MKRVATLILALVLGMIISASIGSLQTRVDKLFTTKNDPAPDVGSAGTDETEARPSRSSYEPVRRPAVIPSGQLKLIPNSSGAATPRITRLGTSSRSIRQVQLVPYRS